MDWIDNTIGLYSQGLIFRAKRAEVLAGNIANADTPNYKARDLDFSAVLKGMKQGRMDGASSMSPRMTDPRHIDFSGGLDGARLEFRESHRAAPDGNTVEPEVELAAYTENALRFQASAQFLDGSLNGLRKAWRGE